MLDVETQNCILRNVVAHWRLYQMGNSIMNAEHDCNRQQTQLMMTKIGRGGGDK